MLNNQDLIYKHKDNFICLHFSFKSAKGIVLHLSMSKNMGRSQVLAGHGEVIQGTVVILRLKLEFPTQCINECFKLKLHM